MPARASGAVPASSESAIGPMSLSTFITRASGSARPIRSLVKPQEARRQSHRQSCVRSNRVRNGLPAGGSRIRTIGSAGGGRHPRNIGSRSRRLFRVQEVKQVTIAGVENLGVSRGTDGSNPASSIGESANFPSLSVMTPRCAVRASRVPHEPAHNLLSLQRGSAAAYANHRLARRGLRRGRGL